MILSKAQHISCWRGQQSAQVHINSSSSWNINEMTHLTVGGELKPNTICESDLGLSSKLQLNLPVILIPGQV